VEPWRLVVVLERLEEMPALTNLLYMLKAAPAFHKPLPHSKALHAPPRQSGKGKLANALANALAQEAESGTEAEERDEEEGHASPLAITALHFVDASSACSDMLRATMPDVAKSTDPTLYMIKVTLRAYSLQEAEAPYLAPWLTLLCMSVTVCDRCLVSWWVLE
jgi:hypothetical protein